jgi:hypothetical protein
MDSNNKPESKPESKFTKEERKMMKKFAKGAIPYLISGTLFIWIFMFLVFFDVVNFGKLAKTKAQNLVDIQSKIAFVLQHSTPGVMWLLVCMGSVIFIRVRSPAMDPISGNEKLTETVKNNFTNSLEQFVMSVMSQLILVTHLSPENTLKYIPVLTFLFILGRITFWLGYPNYRSFGFITTNTPILVTMCYNFYKFFTLYF